MLNHLHKLQSNQDQDSYLPALFDWLVHGIHTGHRKSEWCQDASDFKKTSTYSRTVKNTSTAFIAGDFVLSRKPTLQLSHHQNLQENNYLQITWRFQKNGQNGQVVSFAHNYDTPNLSSVRAAERILARAKRLHLHEHAPQYTNLHSKNIHLHYIPTSSILRSKNRYNT